MNGLPLFSWANQQTLLSPTDEDCSSVNTIQIICWNIANPSPKRAEMQLDWLLKRQDDVIVLTECKASVGCRWLRDMWQQLGYNVVFDCRGREDYSVMMASKQMLGHSAIGDNTIFLQSRLAAATISLPGVVGQIDLVGVYVPSRDSSTEKIVRKKIFTEQVLGVLASTTVGRYRLFCGDLNVLEPSHVPKYPFFQAWEYDFYSSLVECGLVDAFRLLHPTAIEHSWIGRRGDGYRYDHILMSESLSTNLQECYYDHEPRQLRLSDHSAIVAVLKAPEAVAETV